MHKGLKSTLMTIAVALMGLKAMAMAPVINQLPDVIIGDEGGTSGGATISATIDNDFSYPDAFNVDTYASDDNTSDSNLRWSFSNPGGHYSINDRLRTDGSAEDLLNPSPGYSLDGGDDPDAADANKRTLTFRNIQFSPLPLPAAYLDPGTPVGVPSDGQLITLVASDSTTYTAADMMAYIVNDGNDALSGVGTVLPTIDFTGGVTNGWVSLDDLNGLSTVTRTAEANGLCADATAEGINIAGWASEPNYSGAGTEYNTISLVDNAVYQMRMTVSTTAAPGLVPAWFLSAGNTQDLYGGTNLFFDSGSGGVAGPNSPPSAGTRSVFEAWMNAPGVLTSAFKNEVFLPANAANKDFRLKLMVLDVGTAASDNYGAHFDVGKICWKKIEITQYDLSAMQVLSTEYNNTSFVQAVDTLPGVANIQANAVNVQDYSTPGSSTVTINNTGATFVPTSAGAWNTNQVYFVLDVGDKTNQFGSGGGHTAAEMTDNYPVPWDSDTLYRVVYTMVAPDANSELHPPDFFYIGGNVFQNDLIVNTYAASKFNNFPDMPKQGTPQEFITFWHGNSETVDPTPEYHFMRPSFSFGTSNIFIEAGQNAGIKVTAIRVEKVAF